MTQNPIIQNTSSIVSKRPGDQIPLTCENKTGNSVTISAQLQFNDSSAEIPNASV
jgi:hypothetical protein